MNRGAHSCWPWSLIVVFSLEIFAYETTDENIRNFFINVACFSQVEDKFQDVELQHQTEEVIKTIMRFFTKPAIHP